MFPQTALQVKHCLVFQDGTEMHITKLVTKK